MRSDAFVGPGGNREPSWRGGTRPLLQQTVTKKRKKEGASFFFSFLCGVCLLFFCVLFVFGGQMMRARGAFLFFAFVVEGV